MSHGDHHKHAGGPLNLAVLTISDTRTLQTDEGGGLIVTLCGEAGHGIVERLILPDDPARIRAEIDRLCGLPGLHAILLTGGTGLSARDRTFEAVSALLDRRLDGFGEIFRALSFAEIGPAAMLSRAVGGLKGPIAIFAMPGSPKAVRLAMERVILPAIGHVVAEARRAT